MLIETTTNQITIGNFKDTETFISLKKLLIETKPLEVIYNEERLNEEILTMLKTCYFHP